MHRRRVVRVIDPNHFLKVNGVDLPTHAEIRVTNGNGTVLLRSVGRDKAGAARIMRRYIDGKLNPPKETECDKLSNTTPSASPSEKDSAGK